MAISAEVYNETGKGSSDLGPDVPKDKHVREEI